MSDLEAWAALHSILGHPPPTTPEALHGWQLEISLGRPVGHCRSACLCELMLTTQHLARYLPTALIPLPILCRPSIVVAPSLPVINSRRPEIAAVQRIPSELLRQNRPPRVRFVTTEEIPWKYRSDCYLGPLPRTASLLSAGYRQRTEILTGPQCPIRGSN